MQIGFWDESQRLEKLSQLGDSLEELNQVINWEMFRPSIKKVSRKEAKVQSLTQEHQTTERNLRPD